MYLFWYSIIHGCVEHTPVHKPTKKEVSDLTYYIDPAESLKGSVSISGAKNAALPIIAASLLCDGGATLENIPKLSDIRNMISLVRALGADAEAGDAGELSINTENIRESTVPYETAGLFRGSFLVMGALLAKLGKVKIPLPGGCRIGTRPIDLHLKGFAAMGAKIKQNGEYIEAKCPALTGAKIYLDFPSVGATENIIIAGCLAEGTTIIENAAAEPEITDLIGFLNAAGAKITQDNRAVTIKGVKSLKRVSYGIIPDRIEAGTYLAAAALTRGEVTVKNVIPDHLKPVTAKLADMGADVSVKRSTVSVKCAERKLCHTDIKTLPFPGFPTDMQAPFASLLSVTDGTSIIIETIFENRFLHVPQLVRMGAKIKTDGRTAVIEGTKYLKGARVNAPDLRAGAALVIAALGAKGTTEITNADLIERGYESFVTKLTALGAKIEVGEENPVPEKFSEVEK